MPEQVLDEEPEVQVGVLRHPHRPALGGLAGQPPEGGAGMQLSEEPGQGEWAALQDNLGRIPDPSERALFEKEFKRVLRDPNSTNEWPEG